MPRRTSHASNGPDTAPIAFWWNASSSPSVGVLDHQRAADDVGVPAEVLRGRVHDDVGAEGRAAAAGRARRRCCRRPAARPRRGRCRPAPRCRRCRAAGSSASRTQTTLVVRPDRGAHRVEVAERRRACARRPSATGTRAISRNVPPYASSGTHHVVARARRPCAAGCPRRPARWRTRAPRAPPSSAARQLLQRGAGRVGAAAVLVAAAQARRRRPACRSRWRRSARSTAPVRGSGSCPAWIARVSKPAMTPTLPTPSCPRSRCISVRDARTTCGKVSSRRRLAPAHTGREGTASRPEASIRTAGRGTRCRSTQCRDLRGCQPRLLQRDDQNPSLDLVISLQESRLRLGRQGVSSRRGGRAGPGG